MTDLRQAAQQALEALEQFKEISDFTPAMAVHAITALRAALAEPVQNEPLAWFRLDKKTNEAFLVYFPSADGKDWRPLYTAPTPRKPLTEPELHAINPTWPAPGHEWGYEEVLAFVRAIERAHGIGEQT